MFRRLTTLLLLQVALGALPAWVSAQQAEPAGGAKPDSAEVALSEQGPALKRSDLEFLAYAGKRVRRIWVSNLDVFGPSLDDTTRVTESWLARFLNHLNFQTRETTIRQFLLVREGDTIDPFRLAESERLLQNLGFIGDARIVVVPLPGSGDSADVRVIVKEDWTLRLSGLKGGKHPEATLTERNLLGLGHRVSVAGALNPDATPRVGFHTSYSVPNIRGSFVAGTLAYEKMPDNETADLALSRDLISPVLKYAGGLDLTWASIVVADSLSSEADNTSELVDLWAGRLVHQWRSQKEPGRRRILFIAGRVRHLNFTKRPPVTLSSEHPYNNTDHLLGSLTYIQSWYYRTNLLYNFGRTEHIPYGLLARVTYGLADEEFTRSDYCSATLAVGDKIDNLGHAAGEVRIGGYPGSGTIKQGVIRLRTRYFSNLLHAGGFRFRQFVKAEYTTGFHRVADNSIDFDGDETIRGVVYDGSVTGSKRLHLGLETVAFTPWRVWGITLAFFTFADLDFIGSGRRSLLEQNPYSGLGSGVRLHTDGFGIGSVQLRFAWYPRLPVDHETYALTAFAEKRFGSIELLGIQPEIVEY